MAFPQGSGASTHDSTAAQGDHPRLARLLFADLAEQLDSALEQSQRSGAGGPAAPSVDSLLDEAARVARSGELGRAAFAGMPGQEADRFERSFAAARTVAGWAGLSLPEPEAFWESGADHSTLARALMADGSLVAVPAPYGLGAERWTALFRTAARQPASPLSLAAPLVLAPEVLAEFAVLDAAPRAAAVARAGSGQDEPQWTLRLIPASPKPPLVGLSHAHGPHPSLPEILMLQLMLIAAGEPPVDQSSFTWVHGTVGTGRFAARELFDSTERSVRVNTREVGNQGPHLGARPPIG